MTARRSVSFTVGGLTLVAAASLMPLGFLSFSAAAQSADSAGALAFRNAVSEPPPGWKGPVFELSHDYPSQNPGACARDVCTWLATDVDFAVSFTDPAPDWKKGGWGVYLERVLDYVEQGQDPQLGNEAGVRVKVDGRTRWFHVPWMAYDPTAGREFVHGTTNERTAHLADLIGDGRRLGVHTLPGVKPECAAEFPHGFETWSVGIYNEWGGWALGQAWPKDGSPRIAKHMGAAMPAGLPFPEGTVVAKFLTTNAPVKCVDFLKGSPEWQVHRHRTAEKSRRYLCAREVQWSRLVQVDVAVVDLRSPTRWVYGTFAYDGNLPGASVWDRLAPVGVQWGSDPWSFPAVPRSESVPVRQSVLNPEIGIFQHFGCGKRLAGPVDNPMSSCLSCHASGYAAPAGVPSVMGVNAPSSFGFDGVCTQFSQDNVNYFQNLVAPQSYPGGRFPDAMPLDTSLQTWVALNSYGYFSTGGPPACEDPDQF
jgi:hypothetical protein